MDPTTSPSTDGEPVERSEPAEPQLRRVAEGVRQAALAFPQMIMLLYNLLRDPRVPRRRKMLAWAAAGYVILPVDLLPDFIPFLGQADDVLIVAVALKQLIDGAGPEVVAEYWEGSDDVLDVISTVLDWGASLTPRAVRSAIERLTAS